MTEIWTDGSCWPNPGPGGWAAIICSEGREEQLVGQIAEETTNNRAEMTAAIKALQSIGPTEVIVYSDSEYLVRGFNVWMDGWRRNNWTTSSGKPVKNIDLWKLLLEERARHQSIVFKWIRGHSGHRLNELADDLAEGQAKIAAQPIRL